MKTLKNYIINENENNDVLINFDELYKVKSTLKLNNLKKILNLNNKLTFNDFLLILFGINYINNLDNIFSDNATLNDEFKDADEFKKFVETHKTSIIKLSNYNFIESGYSKYDVTYSVDVTIENKTLTFDIIFFDILKNFFRNIGIKI